MKATIMKKVSIAPSLFAALAARTADAADYGLTAINAQSFIQTALIYIGVIFLGGACLILAGTLSQR
jgi:hypothetical protein